MDFCFITGFCNWLCMGLRSLETGVWSVSPSLAPVCQLLVSLLGTAFSTPS